MMEIFNIESNDNTLFVTSQCNNRCLMCCQPPSLKKDIEICWNRNLEIIDKSPLGIRDIGISGGEPTLLGNKLPELIKVIRKKYPLTHLHILSNGRLFKDYTFAESVKEAAHSNITIGVPLHSDYEYDHDYIAGAKGAYQDTMYGLYNLYNCGIDIELRIVINKHNYIRLPQISEFVFKNLPFVTWVAFMAMEDIGYCIKNRKLIWAEPSEYANELEKAVVNLSDWGVDVSIYNIPLCLLNDRIKPFAQQSISDWKTQFIPLCEQCKLKKQCCGLFATAKHVYNGLTPFTDKEELDQLT